MVFTIEQQIEQRVSNHEKELVKCLQNLEPEASEALVKQSFIVPSLFPALGFSLDEIIPEFHTNNTRKVDYALRNKTQKDCFSHSKINSHVLIEVKGRHFNLEFESPGYKSTVKQLKGYLLDKNCKSAQWGIITNSKYIQLFRKHGKVIFPATPCLEITSENIVHITEQIRTKIESTFRALTVSVYNNKGGVGKTTTVINLAAVLTLHKKKVLVVDFDLNQKDLTNSLNISSGEYKFFHWLKDNKNLVNLEQVVHPYTKFFKDGKSITFDVIPVDDDLSRLDEDQIRHEISFNTLRKKLDTVKYDYDYILIDAPPNWKIHSVSAVYAADVVLIPTKHNNIRSLQNAAKTIQQYIPEIQKVRQEKTQGLEWGAIALPIFFNGEKISDAARRNAKNAIIEIIKKIKIEHKFDLTNFFFPYFKPGNNTSIFELANSAHIANSAFDKIPAVYKYKVAYDHYSRLAKEYFL